MRWSIRSPVTTPVVPPVRGKLSGNSACLCSIQRFIGAISTSSACRRAIEDGPETLDKAPSDLVSVVIPACTEEAAPGTELRV